MSLYLGKNASAISILHMTQGNTELADMKNGVLSNTVFHSELPYITWVEHPCWVTTFNGISFIDIGSTTAAAIGKSKLYIIVVDGVVVQGMQDTYTFTSGWMSIKYGGWYRRATYTGEGFKGFYTPTMYPSSSNYLFCPPWGSALTDIHVYTVNVTTESGYLGIDKPTNEILVGNDALVVRGVDLLDVNYISSYPINNVDKKYSLGGSDIQLIGSGVHTVNTLTLVANATETSIYRGTEALFTSLIKSQASVGGSTSLTFRKTSGITTGSGTMQMPTESVGCVAFLFAGSVVSTSPTAVVTDTRPLLIRIGDGVTRYTLRLVNVGGSPVYFYLAVTSVGSVITVTCYHAFSNAVNIAVNCTYFK